MAINPYEEEIELPDISGSVDPWIPGQFEVPPAVRPPPMPSAPRDNRGMGHPSINGGQILPNNSYVDESRFDPTSATGTAGSNVIWESNNERSGGPKTVTQRVIEHLKTSNKSGFDTGPEFMRQAYEDTYQMAKELGYFPGDPKFNQFVDKTMSKMKVKVTEFVSPVDKDRYKEIKLDDGTIDVLDRAKGTLGSDKMKGGHPANQPPLPGSKAAKDNYKREQDALKREDTQKKTAFSQNLAEMRAKNEQIRTDLAVRKADKGDEKPSGEYETERAERNLASIAELRAAVSPLTVGFGSLLSKIPSSDAADFDANLETLKANIGFSELQAMRSASKTGGALGAIAVRELDLLQSALGALNSRQSQESFLKNLAKIESSINKFKQGQVEHGPKPTASPQAGGQVTKDSPIPVGMEKQHFNGKYRLVPIGTK